MIIHVEIADNLAIQIILENVIIAEKILGHITLNLNAIFGFRFV